MQNKAMIHLCITACLLLGFVIFGSSSKRTTASSEESRIEVLSSVKHDSECFTQGLLYYKEQLVETCGLYKRSSIRIIDPKSGAVLKQIRLRDNLFAEGATVVDGLLYVLTWKEKMVLVIDMESFEITQEIHNFHTSTVCTRATTLPIPAPSLDLRHDTYNRGVVFGGT